MLFNSSNSRDFTPGMVIDDNTLEVTEEMKLLGVEISDDM